MEDERQLADTVAKGLRRAVMAVNYDGDDAWANCSTQQNFEDIGNIPIHSFVPPTEEDRAFIEGALQRLNF